MANARVANDDPFAAGGPHEFLWRGRCSILGFVRAEFSVRGGVYEGAGSAYGMEGIATGEIIPCCGLD